MTTKKKISRDKEINIRVSQDEKEKIKNNAQGNVANFMRELALGNVAPQAKITVIKRDNTVYKTANPELLRRLSSIGNLLNQVVRATNTQAKAGIPVDYIRLILAVERTEKLLQEVRDAT